ncbi:MAG: ABC transporter ATP-binding protein [Clostridiaceae bacterium]|jgi:oligopeptide transport system ATP-binding protein|nr:ABC transporter ATP-binding protein [Clostridiaceae bacterium]
MEPNALVEVKNLSVSYFTYAGEVHSVRDISFTLARGKTTALVGESGCGKTVASKSLMGLIERPGRILEGGQILYNGRNVLEFSKKEWSAFRGKECSMIFQDALVSLNPTIPVGKQIVENLKNHNEENLAPGQLRQRAAEMIDMAGIPDAETCMAKYPHELSGGQRQRIMIATAMITRPSLLIADEPTTALDVTIQAQILELMKDLQKRLGMAIVMITHDLGVVADMADDIIVMYAGKIVERGSGDDIFYDPRHPYTWALMNSTPRLDWDSKKPLATIEGTIPDAIHPPAGCPFCSRCPYAMAVCAAHEPPNVTVAGRHQTACWLTDPRADTAGVPFKTGGAVHA